MVNKTKLEQLIRSGIKAPSGHNTQPWRFKIDDSEIQIHPDFTRALSIVDKDNHALYISLGCAAENIVIASTHEGLDHKLDLFRDPEGNDFITIKFVQGESVNPDELFDSIGKRQSRRNKYTDQKVSIEDLNQLRNSFDFEGISLLTITDKKEIDSLIPIIIEGSNRQFENNEFIEELISWIRFSKNEAVKRKDGVWAASMGMPGVGHRIGAFYMRKFVSEKSEAKRWKDLINASAGLALFISNENDTKHWVNLGRAFQRFGLTATKLKISHAHLNMPCEEVDVRKELARNLNLEGKHPLLLLRFGYSEEMPYSFRRDINEVLIGH